MSKKTTFKVKDVIIEVLPNKTYRMELANGHRLLGFVAGRAQDSFTPGPNNKVKLKLSPCDLSQGRIILETKTI